MTNRLKEMILKKSRELGAEVTGDEIQVFDKIYYVDYLNYIVEEIE